MTKRTACVIALLLSNFFLLVHAVVPHHCHEGSGVCVLFTSHYECCGKNEDKDRYGYRVEGECPSDGKHKHEYGHERGDECNGGATSEKCCSVIDDVYTLSERIEEKSCFPHTVNGSRHWVQVLSSDMLTDQNFVDKTPVRFRCKPYIVLLYTGNFPPSFGLRAPPAC